MLPCLYVSFSDDAVDYGMAKIPKSDQSRNTNRSKWWVHSGCDLSIRDAYFAWSRDLKVVKCLEHLSSAHNHILNTTNILILVLQQVYVYCSRMTLENACSITQNDL